MSLYIEDTRLLTQLSRTCHSKYEVEQDLERKKLSSLSINGNNRYVEIVS